MRIRIIFVLTIVHYIHYSRWTPYQYIIQYYLITATDGRVHWGAGTGHADPDGRGDHCSHLNSPHSPRSIQCCGRSRLSMYRRGWPLCTVISLVFHWLVYSTLFSLRHLSKSLISCGLATVFWIIPTVEFVLDCERFFELQNNKTTRNLSKAAVFFCTTH